MAKQIALFNHKGGVGKTTTTFNLGWMLANKGKRVLIVDCDPQCNLTGMVLGFKDAQDADTIYGKKEVAHIRDGLAPAFESQPTLIKPVDCEPLSEQPNMYLLPGHIGLAEYEVTLGVAQELSGSLVPLRNLPGSFHYLFSKTAERYNIDLMLIDMSPSLGPINQNLLVTSDYFIVPMFPDYFSAMATESLATILPKWTAWARRGKALPILRDAIYPFPGKHPKFLGTIIQNYRVKNEIPAAAFRKWIEAIKKGIEERLVPVLSENDMLLSHELYKEVNRRVNQEETEQLELELNLGDESVIGQPLLQLPNFNSLIALSQEHRSPVFDLTDSEIGHTGPALEQTKKSMKKFRNLFAEGAERIIKLTENA